MSSRSSGFKYIYTILEGNSTKELFLIYHYSPHVSLVKATTDFSSLKDW